MRLLLLLGFVSLALSQSEDDNALHFSNEQNGRAVWIVDDTNLPWAGSYDYISTVKAMPNTVLMTIVDSSTGNILGECKTDQHGKWTRFQWVLEANSLHCIVSPTNATRVPFPDSQVPRTFSVRIQAVIGPACVKDLIVQNERPLGCPPRLSRNSFSSLHLQCGCPYDTTSEESTDSSSPQFPIFDLNLSPSPAQVTTEFSLGPCANYNCQNNGTCVVTQDGLPTCLCPSGFIGSMCEVDLCRDVPCQYGGVCKTNGAEAFCECTSGFTGVLCETPVCESKCSNGECVVDEGVPKCECRQGFMGINCNVIDVCLGDAACAMFGDNAKCVVDASSYKINTPFLINATYDCRCPHPVNGEFVDCLQLHLATISGSATVQPAPSPAFPVIDMQSLPGFLPTQTTTKKRILVEESTTALPTLVPDVEIPPTFSVQQPFPESSFQPETVTLPTQESTKQSSLTPFSPTISSNVHPSTFIFPQFPQSTPSPIVVDHQPTHAILPTGPAPQPTLETIKPDIGFPTPAPMPEQETVETVSTEADNNGFGSFRVHPTTITSFKPEIIVTNTPVPETTTEDEEETTVVEYEDESTSSEFATMETTVNTVSSTEATTEEPHIEEEIVEVTSEETTAMPTIPPWLLTSSTTKGMPFVPQVVTEHVTQPTDHVVHPELSEESNTSVENTSNENREIDIVTDSPVSPDVHQQESGGSERQKSSAASWIVAIVALIVLGLLLLAASLFVLRYIKQSRKLHGKYNPAREEHALSSAYSMPMSHITKEERLI